mgnify:CR=1 FL=1
MVVGTAVIDLFIVESRSLKEKRGVLRRIISRVRNTFNVSVAEVDSQDHWKRAVIGFAVVGNETPFVQSVTDKICAFIEELGIAEVVHVRTELIRISRGFDEPGEYGEEKVNDF